MDELWILKISNFFKIAIQNFNFICWWLCTNVLFLSMLCCSQNGDDPQEDLAKSDKNTNMKFENFSLYVFYRPAPFCPNYLSACPHRDQGTRQRNKMSVCQSLRRTFGFRADRVLLLPRARIWFFHARSFARSLAALRGLAWFCCCRAYFVSFFPAILHLHFLCMLAHLALFFCLYHMCEVDCLSVYSL